MKEINKKLDEKGNGDYFKEGFQKIKVDPSYLQRVVGKSVGGRNDPARRLVRPLFYSRFVHFVSNEVE